MLKNTSDFRRKKPWHHLLLLALLLEALLHVSSAAGLSCLPGVYHGDNHTFVAITIQQNGYQFMDSTGEYGRLSRADTAIQCDEHWIIWRDKRWDKQNVYVVNTRFSSQEAVLAGQLILVENANRHTPLVVYAHGSERTGWIESAMEPYQLLARGISVFVYDKRGTGRSTGQYNQNFPLLAKDLVAASLEAKRLAVGHFGRFGLIGLSQGGWVVPLASNDADADFIAIGYGLITDFTSEDADQVQLEITALGLGEREKAAARRFTDITARMIKSNYRNGFNELIDLKKTYAEEPWLSSIKGSYTGVLIATPPETLLSKGIPFFDSLDVDWTVDPVQNVKAVHAPQYWALAEKDREAPIQKTLKILLELQQHDHNIQVRIFPNSDHGMILPGEGRISTGYFDSQADFAKGEMKSAYGGSWVP